MNCYIAGPMRGIENFNYDAFYAAEGVVRKMGYCPINPARMDIDEGFDLESLIESGYTDWWKVPPGLEIRDIISRDLDAIQDCSAMFLLPGWEGSMGAKAEKHLAEWLGLEMIYADNCEYQHIFSPPQYVDRIESTEGLDNEDQPTLSIVDHIDDTFYYVIKGERACQKRRDSMEAKTRKNYPVGTGCIDYFPDALMEVAKLSKIGNEQHNPGQPLHWDKSKSNDHDDCLLRHYIDRDRVDTDGVLHRTKLAWRALAGLQRFLEDYHAKTD